MIYCNNYIIYTVIHDETNLDLHIMNCKILTKFLFDDFAIDRSLGKNHQKMFDLLNFIVLQLSSDKLNHLLSTGDLKSLAAIIMRNIDIIDNVQSTRSVRYELLFTKQEKIKILHQSYKKRFTTPELSCI